MSSSRSSLARAGVVCTALALVGPIGLLTVPSAASAGASATASTANGEGNLGVSLTPTTDARIKVSWKPPAPTDRLRQWVVRTSTARTMGPDLRTYTAAAGATSLVVPRAAMVTSASGDSSFVKVQLIRSDGSSGYSPTKWIKAPVVVAPASDTKVTMGTFNVRSWNVESSPADLRSWKNRRDDVVRTISSSGADVVTLQEAGGSVGHGYGDIRQWDDLLSRLPGNWRLADDKRYDSTHGSDVGGRQGTRILYDGGRYTELGHGALEAAGQTRTAPAWTPWVKLQDTRSLKKFYVISVHLENGKDAAGSRRYYDLRLAQATVAIDLAKKLWSSDGNEVFVAGDLNSTALTLPDNGVHRAFVKAGFVDAFSTGQVTNGAYPTTNNFDFPVVESPIRRDYIMSYGPLRGAYWFRNLAYQTDTNAASDHFMQVSQLPF